MHEKKMPRALAQVGMDIGIVSDGAHQIAQRFHDGGFPVLIHLAIKAISRASSERSTWKRSGSEFIGGESRLHRLARSSTRSAISRRAVIVEDVESEAASAGEGDFVGADADRDIARPIGKARYSVVNGFDIDGKFLEAF